MSGAPWMAMWVLSGCDDTAFPGVGGGGQTIGDAEGWCAVRIVFAGTCVRCHSASAAAGGLDLETDPHGAVVDVTSAAYGAPLVVPGDPDGSLLFRKLEGTHGPDEGGAMPPDGAVEPAVIDVVRKWIADGAPGECDGTTELPTAGSYHPDGWKDPIAHGTAMKLHRGPDADCRECHGTTLEGDIAPACASCHPGWETTCTFCHGDADRDVPEASQPAPPQDIDDTDPGAVSFPAHLKHLTESDLHADWDCAECHVKPTSALDPAHVFDDDSPAEADVRFTGVSADGRFEAGSCSNLYCHGNGQENGTVSTAAGSATCDSCHDGPGSDGRSMSGRHEDHLDEDLRCSECHAATVGGGGDIVGRGLHVNGEVDVDFGAANMAIANLRCNGACHGEPHSNRYWLGDDDDD